MHLEEIKSTSQLKVKLLSGASVVRIKPLFTYDSKCVIVASGSDVKVYNIQSGVCLHTLRHHKKRIISLQENKNNSLQIFSCSEDGVVVRWDYSEGIMLQVLDLHMNVANFYIPSNSTTWFVIKKIDHPDSNEYRLYSFARKASKCINFKVVLSSVVPKENTVAFGYEGKFIAAVFENALSICDLNSGKIIRHLTGERKLTCVACHPTDTVVATGDDQGRVLVWSNLMNVKKVIKSIFHWHTLPVADIAFSTEGCYLYSGGGEATLVKWNLFHDERSFLPRLGAPIRRVNVSPDNTYVVAAHDDNSLQIINSQKVVIQVIQALTQGHFQGAKDLLPTGLLYDPLSRSIVLNGRPGHLQFYSIHEDKQLFNLDIACRNFISGERESMVLNTDVQKAAIHDKGHWLAAVEYWNDEKTSAQIWLKFWEFDLSKQTYVLNTNVTLPHTKEINCLVFRPATTSSEGAPLAITTSNDCQFKVWILKEDSSYADKLSWSCKSMGCYRDLPAGDACFSEDGSLLAVAFGKVATLWTVDSITLKKVLVDLRQHNLKSKNNIKQLVFGRQSCSHLLVCQDGTSLTVWNVLSLSITWTIHTGVQTIVADISSDMIAAFCEDQTMIIFKPDNPEPIDFIEMESEIPVVAAIFVPTKNPSEGSFTKNSKLFFFDADQNLLTLSAESDEMESSKIQKVNQYLPVTPFGKLQAENQVSGVKVFEQVQMHIPTVTNQDLEISCPTYMDPVALCSNVLKSLLIKKKATYEKAINLLTL